MTGAPGVLDATGGGVPPQRRANRPFAARRSDRHRTGQLTSHVRRSTDTCGEAHRPARDAAQQRGARAQPRTGRCPAGDQRSDEHRRRRRISLPRRHRRRLLGSGIGRVVDRAESRQSAAHRAGVELRKPWCAISSSSVNGSSLSLPKSGPGPANREHALQRPGPQPLPLPATAVIAPVDRTSLLPCGREALAGGLVHPVEQRVGIGQAPA